MPKRKPAIQFARVLYFQGPFYTPGDFVNHGTPAPLNMQPGAVVRAIAKHALTEQGRADATRELQRRREST